MVSPDRIKPNSIHKPDQEISSSDKANRPLEQLPMDGLTEMLKTEDSPIVNDERENQPPSIGPQKREKTIDPKLYRAMGLLLITIMVLMQLTYANSSAVKYQSNISITRPSVEAMISSSGDTYSFVLSPSVVLADLPITSSNYAVEQIPPPPSPKPLSADYQGMKPHGQARGSKETPRGGENPVPEDPFAYRQVQDSPGTGIEAIEIEVADIVSLNQLVLTMGIERDDILSVEKRDSEMVIKIPSDIISPQLAGKLSSQGYSLGNSFLYRKENVNPTPQSYEQFTDELFQLAVSYPELVSIFSLGKGTNDFDLWDFQIKSADIADRDNPSNPRLFIEAGIHGDEHTERILLSTLKLILENKNDPAVSYIRDNLGVIIEGIIANPNGIDLGIRKNGQGERCSIEDRGINVNNAFGTLGWGTTGSSNRDCHPNNRDGYPWAAVEARRINRRVSAFPGNTYIAEHGEGWDEIYEAPLEDTDYVPANKDEYDRACNLLAELSSSFCWDPPPILVIEGGNSVANADEKDDLAFARENPIGSETIEEIAERNLTSILALAALAENHGWAEGPQLDNNYLGVSVVNHSEYGPSVKIITRFLEEPDGVSFFGNTKPDENPLESFVEINGKRVIAYIPIGNLPFDNDGLCLIAIQGFFSRQETAQVSNQSEIVDETIVEGIPWGVAFVNQTNQPSLTPTVTVTPTATITPSATPIPSESPTPTSTITATVTATKRLITPSPSLTPTLPQMRRKMYLALVGRNFWLTDSPPLQSIK